MIQKQQVLKARMAGPPRATTAGVDGENPSGSKPCKAVGSAASFFLPYLLQVPSVPYVAQLKRTNPKMEHYIS